MSATLKTIIIFAAVQVCAFSMNAQGVIANDAAILPAYYGSGQFLTLTNSINYNEGRYGLFAINISTASASQFTFSYSGIAEEYALYSVTPGIAITPDFATSTTRLVSNNGVDPGSSVQTFSVFQSRMFGYWDDRTGSGNLPSVNDNYGWVVITRTGSGLQVSSSATAIGGGIIAGTLTQIPEPSISTLALLGFCFGLGVRRFRFVAQRRLTNR